MKTVITMLIGVTGWFGAIFVAFPITATASDADEVLIFAFFRGNGEDGMYLAASEDGIRFTPLNNDRPVMKPGPWSGQGLVRDPQIIFHDGTFHAAWTTAWAGNGMGHAESKDLVKWSQPDFIKPFPSAEPQPRSTWFSWICWDPYQTNFIITWSSDALDCLGRSDGGQLYIMRTTDWKSYTEPKKLLDQAFPCLDGDLVLDVQAKRWVMTIKNEESMAKGGKNLLVATCPADFSTPWVLNPTPIIGPGTSIHSNTMVEGGCLLKQKDGWFLYWDVPESHPPAYGLASSVDLVTWTNRSAELQMPNGRRHGNISRVPRRSVGWLENDRSANNASRLTGDPQQATGR